MKGLRYLPYLFHVVELEGVWDMKWTHTDTATTRIVGKSFKAVISNGMFRYFATYGEKKSELEIPKNT